MYFDIQCVQIKIRKRKYIQVVLDFSLQSSIKWDFSLILSLNFQCNSMMDVVKFCASGTLVKKVINNFYSFFLYIEV